MDRIPRGRNGGGQEKDIVNMFFQSAAEGFHACVSERQHEIKQAKGRQLSFANLAFNKGRCKVAVKKVFEAICIAQ